MIKERLKKLISNQEVISSIGVIRTYFWRINWIKTIWFNFKVLPFKQALHIPFIVAYNVHFNSIGTIRLVGDVYLGMVSIGVVKINRWETNSDELVISNNGIILLHGRTKIHPGAKIVIYPNATLECGERTSIGCQTKLICREFIKIGRDFQISWNGQIFDTDFHFLQNTNTGMYYHRIKPVIIGDDVFIGNSSTIGKGTILPNGCVVSCCSKVSGDYTKDGCNLLISGNPAMIVKKGVQMGNGFFPQKEQEIAILMGERWQ